MTLAIYNHNKDGWMKLRPWGSCFQNKPKYDCVACLAMNSKTYCKYTTISGTYNGTYNYSCFEQKHGTWMVSSPSATLSSRCRLETAIQRLTVAQDNQLYCYWKRQRCTRYQKFWLFVLLWRQAQSIKFDGEIIMAAIFQQPQITTPFLGLHTEFLHIIIIS